MVPWSAYPKIDGPPGLICPRMDRLPPLPWILIRGWCRTAREISPCARENLYRVKFIATCTWCDFLGAVELLYLTHLSPFSTSPCDVSPSILQCPKWACLAHCTHTESPYRYLLNGKTCLERSGVRRAISLLSESLLTFATLNFHGVLIFAFTAQVEFNCENFAPRIAIVYFRKFCAVNILGSRR